MSLSQADLALIRQVAREEALRAAASALRVQAKAPALASAVRRDDLGGGRVTLVEATPYSGSASVGLSGFSESDRSDTEITWAWSRGAGVVAVKVWESTSLPWPAVTSTPDDSLGGGTDEHTATLPTSGYLYVQFATEDAGGVRRLQQRLILAAAGSGDATPLFSGTIYPAIASGAVDLTVSVDGDAGAFPMDIEVRAETRAGGLLASHTFTAAGSVDKNDYAALGGRDPSQLAWWLKMTPATGPVLWVNFPNPFVTETTVDDGAISAAKIQAGAVTATKISVVDLAAINADLGIITAGTIHGTDLYMKYGDNSISLVDEANNVIGGISVTRYGSAPDYVYELTLSLSSGGAVVLNNDPALPQLVLTGGADIDVIHVGTLRLESGAADVSYGADDSGGAGYKLLRVAN